MIKASEFDGKAIFFAFYLYKLSRIFTSHTEIKVGRLFEHMRILFLFGQAIEEIKYGTLHIF